MKLLRIGIVLVSLMLLAMPPVIEAVEVQRVEETDPSFVWTGRWDACEDPNLSGGSGKVAFIGSGAKVDITFTGTGVALIYGTYQAGPIVNVWIDGGPYPDIDMYSPNVRCQVKKVIATNLANTQHMLTIAVSDTKNPEASDGGQALIDAIEIYTPTPAAFTVSNITISPATVGVGQSVTITVNVTNSGDLGGAYTVTLKIDDVVVGNKDVTVAGGATETVSFTVSKGTTGVYGVAVDGQTGFFTVFSTTLTFRDRQRNVLINTSIYYGLSSGQETNYLGTTDNDGKITSNNPELAGKTIYFKTSDGKYAGSVYVDATGGEVTAELTEVSEFPTLWVVVAVVIVAAAIGALVLVKKRK